MRGGHRPTTSPARKAAGIRPRRVRGRLHLVQLGHRRRVRQVHLRHRVRHGAGHELRGGAHPKPPQRDVDGRDRLATAAHFLAVRPWSSEG